MKRVYAAVIWANTKKDSVIYKMLETRGRRETKRVGECPRFDINDPTKNSDQFQQILDQGWSIERIEEETNLNRKREEDQQKIDDQRAKEERDYKKVRELFQTKIDIFNIEAVQNSDDKAGKAAIRKAKTPTEAIVLASVLIMKGEHNDKEDTN